MAVPKISTRHAISHVAWVIIPLLSSVNCSHEEHSATNFAAPPKPPPAGAKPIDLGKPPITKKDPMARHVAVLMNEDSAQSVAIAKYYAEARGVPEFNIVRL